MLYLQIQKGNRHLAVLTSQHRVVVLFHLRTIIQVIRITISSWRLIQVLLIILHAQLRIILRIPTCRHNKIIQTIILRWLEYQHILNKLQMLGKDMVVLRIHGHLCNLITLYHHKVFLILWMQLFKWIALLNYSLRSSKSKEERIM